MVLAEVCKLLPFIEPGNGARKYYFAGRSEDELTEARNRRNGHSAAERLEGGRGGDS